MSIKRKAETYATPVKLAPTEPTSTNAPKKAKKQIWKIRCPGCKKNPVEISYEPEAWMSFNGERCDACAKQLDEETVRIEKEQVELKRKCDEGIPVSVKEAWIVFKSFGGNGRNGDWIIECQDVDKFLGLDQDQ